MSNPFIEYRSGYKYQLASDYSIKTNIKPKKEVDEKFLKLDKKGNVTVVEGYAVADNYEALKCFCHDPQGDECHD